MNKNYPDKNLELLAPAGNKSAFAAALNAGADAIYLGIDRFNARRGADNFSIDELADAVRRAHIRGAKVYVTFNTLVSDEELPAATESLALINNAGADAVIVQDWGIFDLVKQLIPDLSIHASTQMNTHNIEMVKFLEEKGAKRVTLARELAIEEISKICDSTSLEVETFIHGALCFSYSGQCLFSSMVGNRSGNRGLCPQACRMGYELVIAGKKEEVWPTPGKHLLSTKDLCGIRLIPELAKAGVKALKIEGRVKSPEYVATVVRIYRDAIDRFSSDPDNFNVSEDEIDELREAFSRGFTEGYFKKVRDGRLMSFERPNDRGIFLGRTTYLDVYTGRLGIQLKRELCAGDEIEVWVTKGGRVKTKAEELYVGDKQVKCAPVGSKAVIVIKGKRHTIKMGDRVFRVHNAALSKKAKDTISGAGSTRVPIEIAARIEAGKPVELKARIVGSDGGQDAEVKSDFLAEKGERRTLSTDDVIAQLNRLGNTVYKVDSWDIKVGPGVMVPLGKLNDLRRSLTEYLDTLRAGAYEHPKVSVAKIKEGLPDILKPESFKAARKPYLAADINNLEQAREAAQGGADWLYIRPGFSRLGGAELDQLSSLRSSGTKVALATGNILHGRELESLIKFIQDNIVNLDAVLVDNFGVYYAARDIGLPMFLDYHVNNFNRISTRFFRDGGVSRVCLSPELTLEQIVTITNSVDVECETIVHGWLEIMTAEHCVPSASKKSCEVCSSRGFYITDQKGFKFPVEQDTRCRSHIYNSRELYMLPNTGNLVGAGLSSMRLLLNRYAPGDVGKAVSLYREALDLITSGVDDITPVLKKAELMFPSLTGMSTTGHFFRQTL